jgi:hypothetical protein
MENPIFRSLSGYAGDQENIDDVSDYNLLENEN